MKETDIKIPEEAAIDLKVGEVIPVTLSDAPVAEAEATAPEAAVANKITPGRKMRGEPARRGAPSTGPGGARSPRSGGNRGEPRERVKPEFDSKIIQIRRVTRVTSGGRRMAFSVAVVAGDRKGRVGVGSGKSIDTASAVEKATREARKNLIRVPLSANRTIPHAVDAKFSGSRVMIFPARGRGVVAGSSARAIIELAGIHDVCAKLMSGSKNSLNNAKATIAALKKLSTVSRAVMNGGKGK
jgi:small subunit ribosomal protein S5